MLSVGRIGAPQLPQREPGRTTDWPAGTRAMQTLKKLPQIAPNAAAKAANTGDDRSAPTSSMSAKTIADAAAHRPFARRRLVLRYRRGDVEASLASRSRNRDRLCCDRRP